jgi:hypothetical protein
MASKGEESRGLRAQKRGEGEQRAETVQQIAYRRQELTSSRQKIAYRRQSGEDSMHNTECRRQR